MNYPLTVGECYIIGALLGDGEVRHYNKGHSDYRIRLWSRDKEFATQFFNALCRFKMRREQFRRYGVKGCRSSPRLDLIPHRDSKIYCVRWSSKKAYYVIMSLMDKLQGNFAKVGKKRAAAFLKGLYDAEGNYWHEGNHHRLNIYNTDQELIALAENALAILGFKPYKYMQHRNNGEKDLYCLRITRKGNVQRFFRWIRPFNRKFPTNRVLPHLNRLGQKRYALES